MTAGLDWWGRAVVGESPRHWPAWMLDGWWHRPLPHWWGRAMAFELGARPLSVWCAASRESVDPQHHDASLEP